MYGQQPNFETTLVVADYREAVNRCQHTAVAAFLTLLEVHTLRCVILGTDLDSNEQLAAPSSRLVS